MTDQAGGAQAGGGSENQAVAPVAAANPQPVVDAVALGHYRAAIATANPDAVAELIGGGSFAEIDASVALAKTAYQRIAAGIKPPPAGGAPAVPVIPVVPAGGATAPVTNVEALSPYAKLQQGLAARRAKAP